MIMSNFADDPRKPSASHPWRKKQPKAESAKSPDPATRLNRKASMAITAHEEKALRARACRAGGLSVSAFLRAHFPPELLIHPDEEE